MNYLSSPLITLLILVSVFLSGCKDPGAAPPVFASAQDKAPATSEFPKIYQKLVESGSEVESSSSYSMGDHSKLLKVLEDQFHKHLEISRPEDETLFGIRQEDGSLMIKFSPNASRDARTATAIWKYQETEKAKANAVMTKYSEPLASDDQALQLIKAYAKMSPEFESLATWTTKTR